MLTGGWFGIRLQAAVGTNVLHLHAAITQHTGDHQPAVTALRVLFGAHHRDAIAVHHLEQPCDALLELGHAGDQCVEHVAFGVVKVGPVGPAAKLAAGVGVADAVPETAGLSAGRLNCGAWRENGADRTSTRAVIACLFRRPRNASASRLLCPMV